LIEARIAKVEGPRVGRNKERSLEMIGKTIQKAINKQINAELYSAYLYYSMSAYFEEKNLSGFANWMRIQALEEQTHAHKFYSYLIERGGRVELEPIKGPETSWESPLAAFEAAYNHERHVTELINDMVNLAQKEKDHATNNFLQWYVDEQVEEEATADEIVEKIKMVEKAPGGIYMLDKEIGQRSFAMPPWLSGGGEQ
jgi:ferritin